eukprot:CAMPEP_0181116366 /NCGR_PEP_ID=MMETSP1071-20121207/21911_1 /TAXON_ID=35127 /ORGANISM="Thalassiosira sp., Strain NH16" /LENGTH=364 /DNA_ID=CAMNT_0023200603 /DNA_START=388 /DNA_END=1486 /DNA_ORIENTATION=-
MTAPSALVLLLALCRTASSFVSPISRTTSTTTTTTATTTRLRMEVIECDVAIVGGGPAGCTCALYTSRADLSTVILDKNPASGALAITSHIANYPGVESAMSGEELLDQMRNQAVQYGARYERAQVFMIDVSEDETGDGVYTKCVYTPDYTVKARSLVLATGAMGRVGKPFPGEKEYLGSGVSYCATCDAAFYRDSVVAVYGASTEAIEEALFLTKFARRVHWITSVDISKETESGIERNKVLDQNLLEQLYQCDNVDHMEQTRLIEVVGEMGGVTGVKVKRRGREEEEFIEAEEHSLELDEGGGVVVDEDMKTSRDGVYAIGDIRNTDYKQVVVAASDGCIAAMSLEKFLNNRKTVKVDWIHK